MRMDGLARYAILGALAVSLACARNSEETDTGATGSVTAADTGVTVRVRPDTNAADTSQGAGTNPDSAAGEGEPVRPTPTDSTRTDSAGGGWPVDSLGGWPTPPDSL
jgi:hypothetical protein